MMFNSLSHEACYQAMKSHDLRFDGHFFVGVRTTGIYCRPICRVRLPKQQNCTFHPSAAAAELAGFRPCLRCRPELAPGVAASEASQRLAHTAARMIEDDVASDIKLTRIASRLGVSDRHMRRIFSAEYGVSPVQFAQTQRLLLAKRLLTDTTLPIADIAFASGFSSIRRMNALFAARYRFSPGRLRQEGRGNAEQDSAALSFLLPYRPPYDFDRLLAFLGKRAVPGVESVTETTYRRVICATDSKGRQLTGWMEIRDVPERHALHLRFASGLASAARNVLSRAKQVFDVGADPGEINDTLGTLTTAAPGMRLPGAFDAFELALRAILGQQVTVKAARTLASRFVTAYGEPLVTPFAELERRFPTPAQVALLTRDAIAHLGIVGQRAEAMIALAQAIETGDIELSANADPGQLIERLCRIRGIGQWTAHYIAMRALAWPDAWLVNDVALQNALKLPNNGAGNRQAAALAESWRPWRSYAVLHLWQSLDNTNHPEIKT